MKAKKDYDTKFQLKFQHQQNQQTTQQTPLQTPLQTQQNKQNQPPLTYYNPRNPDYIYKKVQEDPKCLVKAKVVAVQGEPIRNVREVKLDNSGQIRIENEHGKSFQGYIRVEKSSLPSTNPEGVQNHAEKRNQVNPNPKCEHCVKEFVNPNDLEMHIQIAHRDLIKPHKCEICGKAFKKFAHLKVHISHQHSQHVQHSQGPQIPQFPQNVEYSVQYSEPSQNPQIPQFPQNVQEKQIEKVGDVDAWNESVKFMRLGQDKTSRINYNEVSPNKIQIGNQKFNMIVNGARAWKLDEPNMHLVDSTGKKIQVTRIALPIQPRDGAPPPFKG